MKEARLREIKATPYDFPPRMRTDNEHDITSPPCETTQFTDADTVWDCNFPRGLEVVSHGMWKYGPRGAFDV